MRKIFERERNDTSATFAGRSHIEYTRLSFDIDHALENEFAIAWKFRPILRQLTLGANRPDPGAAAADVRLGDQRKSQARILK